MLPRERSALGILTFSYLLALATSKVSKYEDTVRGELARSAVLTALLGVIYYIS